MNDRETRKVRALRLSPTEERQIAEAAAVNRQTFSAFARDVLLDAVSECLEGRTSATGRGAVLTPSGVIRA